MFKLISEQEKKKVNKEYVLRRAIVMAAALSGVLVVAIVGLFPSYLLSDSRHAEALARSEILKISEKQEERADLSAWLKDTNNKLALLSPALDTDRPNQLFKIFIDDEVGGIKVTSLLWKKEKEKVSLVVSGVADTRQDLIRFEGIINSSGKFTQVSLPVSQFAKEKEIDFQLTVVPLKVTSR